MAKSQVKAVLNSNRSKWEKAQYLFQVYWWVGAVALVVILLIGSFVVTATQKKEVILNVSVLANKDQPDRHVDMTKTLNKWVKYDHNKQELYVAWGNANDTVAQEKFVTTLASGDTDLVISSTDKFHQNSKHGGLAPLPLTKTQLSRLHDDLLFDKQGQAIGVKVEASPQLQQWDMKDSVMYIPVRSKHKANVKRVVQQLLAQ